MIPIRDDNPTTITPVVTIAIIGLCSLVFLWQVTLPSAAATRAVYSYGVIPAVLFGREALPPELARVPAAFSVLTAMFLHGGWMHLIGNMLYLWIFGNNIEDSMGHVRFAIFYVLCGAAAALAQSALDPSSIVPMIGASGAIAGVLGAYLVLFPRAHVTVIPLGFYFQPMRLPAILVLGFWFVLQFIQGGLAAGTKEGGGVAYWAHIGGFVAGIALIFLFRRRQSPPRFGGRRTGPWG